ncbi:MAG: hypothetical protein MUO50_07850, partial [Longimicrobiales bacterium]|nr:hypothetical protein [Longimicrobiales bacterium]
FRFEISFSQELSSEAQDGRIILLISNREGEEPRFQYDLFDPETQLGFGMDVEDFGPGDVAVMDGSTFGFPLKSLDDLPPGEYRVQAVLNRYETFVRGDGHTVSFPPDQGEGQHWNSKPGNLHSAPQTVRVDSSQGRTVRLSLDQEIPPIPEFQDTPWIKHVQIQSELLSEFRGRPMYLGAYILLPAGFDEHPEARYPIAIHHGHFPRGFPEFRDEPPSSDLTGYDRTRAEYGFDLYQKWTSPGFPRMLTVKIEHANPYYDDSYAVNSENVGPYGDAIVEELLPYLEERFRGIGEGWSRVMFGGSTGGWEVLGQQIFYPDEFNGAWSFCPDAVDFRHYETVDIYSDDNAYFMNSDWKRTPKPSGRNWLGLPISMIQEDITWEMVLGSRGRSGEQWSIWEAVYGPVGEDGYTAPIWDRVTGEIDREVAEYWRENYDLRHILERDWATLGPKLVGKLRIYIGDMDNWYLNNAVYFMEDFLENTREPYYGGLVEYGDRYEHCWSGDHEEPLEIQGLTVYQRFFPQFAVHILRTAPAGADLSSWRY